MQKERHETANGNGRLLTLMYLCS